MTNYNRTHYKELKRLLSCLRGTRRRYEQIFGDAEFKGCRVLTVGGDGGYPADNAEGAEIIEALADNDYLTAVDNPDNPNDDETAIGYYLINDYDDLLERVSTLIEELRP